MLHDIHENEKLIINLTECGYSEAIKCREKNSELREKIKLVDNIHYCSIDIVFSNNERFIASNLPLCSLPYLAQGCIKTSFVPLVVEEDRQNSVAHERPAVNELQSYVKQIMSECYQVFPLFAILKRAVEMTLVFQFFSNCAISNPNNIYRKNKIALKDFCWHCLSNLITEIKASHPTCQAIKILNDQQALMKLIYEEDYTGPSLLTKREVDCLNWLSKGKTAEQTAKLLYISPETVRSHIKTIRTKLKTTNLAHTITETIRLGYLR